MQKTEILKGDQVAMTGDPVAVDLRTILGRELLSSNGADLYLSAPEGNAAAIELTRASETHGILLPPGQTFVFPSARVADGLWEATGTAADVLKIALVGPA